MAYDLENKVVLITGAATGIGARVVKLLLEEGVKYVAFLDIAEESGIKLQKDLNDKYKENRVEFIKCDVTNEEQLSGAFRTVIDKNGYLDVVINNAGIMNDSLKTYKKEIDLNLTALVTGTLKALEIMRKDENGRGGTVIWEHGIAPAKARRAKRRGTKYLFSKRFVGFLNPYNFGLDFTRQTKFSVYVLEEYSSKTGVRVLTVCFGATDTALIHAGNLDTFDKEIRKELWTTWIKEKQSAESAARGVIEVFKSGESGSTWLVSHDQPAKEITHDIKSAYGLMTRHVFPE